MIRITAGTLRGRRIPVPKDLVRPTSERARQAFFNIAGARIHEARFLDLFAGSGIFSFEAVSRGDEKSFILNGLPFATGRDRSCVASQFCVPGVSPERTGVMSRNEKRCARR